MTLSKDCPKLCQVIEMLRIPLLELILKHGSLRSGQELSIALFLSFNEDSPHVIRGECLIIAVFYQFFFKDYEGRNYFAIKH